MIIDAAQIFLFITAIVLAILWIRNRDGNYEPWTVICFAVVVFIGYFCRKRLINWFQKYWKKSPRDIQELTLNDIKRKGWRELEDEEITQILHREDNQDIPDEKKFATKFKSFVFEIPKDHCPRPQLANKDINIEFWFSGFFSQTMIKNDSVFDEIISKMPYLFSESKLPVDCIFVLDCRRSAGVTGDFLHIPGNLGKHGFIETVARQFPTNLDYAGILYIDDLQMWRHKEREIIPEIQKHKNILILEPVAYPDDNLKNILSLIRKYSDHPITCITVVFLGNDKQKKRHKNSVGRNCDIKVLYRLDLYQKPTNLKVGYSKGTTKKQNIIRNGKGVD